MRSSTDTSTDILATQSTRKRRCPYTTIACDSCKRRKTKCSGGQPCQGCCDINTTCVYKRTTRFRSTTHSSAPGKISLEQTKRTGQDWNQTLSSNESSNSGSEAAEVEGSTSTSEFGPATSDYYFGIAKSRLVVSSSEWNGTLPKFPFPTVDGSLQLNKLLKHIQNGSPNGFFAALSQDCWNSIILAYHEEIGLQYPFIDLDELKKDISLETTLKTDRDSLRHNQLSGIVTIILAIVAIFTNAESLDASNALVEDVFSSAIARAHLTGGDKYNVYTIILSSIYYFLTDREVRAWRCIGTVARLLQEQQSLNRDLPSTQIFSKISGISPKLFWSVYTLDRRWSFGASLPFALQDIDIQHYPKFKDGSLSSAYLEHMVAYCSIASEVRRWCLDTQSTVSPAFNSACDFLCFRVNTWQKNLPAKLQFHGPQDRFDPVKESRGTYKIRLTLYLRANQMCTVIYRKATVRSSISHFDSSYANTMATIARDTVCLLDELARETNIYQSQQKTFNHFLETALSALLLILCCSDDPGRLACLTEALVAMNLIRQLSAQSSISRKLRNKLQTFQAVIDNLQGENQNAGSQPQGTESPNNDFPAVGLISDLSNSPSVQDNLTLGTPSSYSILPTSSIQPSTAIPLDYTMPSFMDNEASNLPFLRFPELCDYLVSDEINLFI